MSAAYETGLLRGDVVTWTQYTSPTPNEPWLSLEDMMRDHRDELRMTWLPMKPRTAPPVMMGPRFMRTFRGFLFSIGKRR
jgi:hypothetical protein